MSDEYALLCDLPGQGAAETALRRAGQSLKADVQTDEDGDLRFEVGTLLAYAIDVDDDDRQLSRSAFDFENNVALVFSDFSAPDSSARVQALQNILRAFLDLVQLPDFRGVLIEDYSDESFLASASHGRFVLGRAFWNGQHAAEEILAVLPQPHRFEDLRVS